MTTSIEIPYTINAAELTLTNTGRVMGIPAGQPLSDLQDSNPVEYTAIMEFKALGTTSGVVSVSAV